MLPSSLNHCRTSFVRNPFAQNLQSIPPVEPSFITKLLPNPSFVQGCNEVSSGGTPPPSSSIIHSLTCMELGMGCASMQQLPDSFPRDNCQPMQGGESQGYLGLLQLQQQEVLLCNGLQCRQPGEARWSDARGHMLNQGQGHNSKLMSIAEHVGAMPLLGSGQFNLGTGDSGPPLLGSRCAWGQVFLTTFYEIVSGQQVRPGAGLRATLHTSKA